MVLLFCSAWIWRIRVRSICLIGICMSLVTSPLSAEVTGNAAGVIMCWPGASAQADSMAAIARAIATRVPGTAWLFLFGTAAPDICWLFMLSSPASISVGVAQTLEDRREDNFHIQSERPVPEVVQIVCYASLHFFDAIGFAAKAVHLRPPGNTGFDPVAVDVTRYDLLIEIVVFERMRTRSDHRHVAAQYVEELRQFVQARAAQETAYARDPRVAAFRLFDYARFLRMNAHGAELVDGEDAAIRAFAALLEEHRTTRTELHRNRAGKQDRRDREQGAQREEAIEGLLLHHRVRRQRRRRQVDGRHTEQVRHAAFEERQRAHVGHKTDVDQDVAKFVYQLEDRAFLGQRQREPDFTHVLRAHVVSEGFMLFEHRHTRVHLGAGLYVVGSRRTEARCRRRVDLANDLVAMFTASRDCNLLQIQACVAHASQHAVRDQAAGDHRGACHAGPVDEPETRHEVDTMQGEHQRHCADLHDEPAQRDLPGECALRAATP